MLQVSIKDIAKISEAEIVGNDEVVIIGFAPIEQVAKNQLSFLANAKYSNYLERCPADSVVIVSKDYVSDNHIKATLLKVTDVYQTVSKLLSMFIQSQHPKAGIDATSSIHQSAEIFDNVHIGAFCYIGENVKIHKNAVIYPQCYIGDNAIIGENTVIYPQVTIYPKSLIGNQCVIHSGTVIGADGFGFAPSNGNIFGKIPQTGNVIIEDFVEIGANCTIDRATFTSTIIRKGVKLDNLIQVAHNVEIGENTVIAAQTGISGSTKIGKNCMIAGQVGIVGHIQIADGTLIGAQSGIAQKIENAGSKWFGSPAMPAIKAKRKAIAEMQLPELINKVNQLEQKLKELSSTKNGNE